MDLDQAQTALRKAKLKLGPANGDGVKGVVARQAPQPGERARVGTGVTVWLATPEKKPAPAPPTETTETETRLSLADLRTLAIADAKGIWIDPPASNDSLRLNTEPGDSDPTWLGDRVVFQRAGQLFIVDADEQAEPEPLTDAEGWSSPTATAGTLAAIQDEQICVRVDRVEVPCARRRRACRLGIRGRLTDRARRRQGAPLRRRRRRPGDVARTRGDRDRRGCVRRGRLARGHDRGLHGHRARTRRRRFDPAGHRRALRNRLPGRHTAGRRAAAGTIRLADIESGATRALDGDRGAQIAFK